MKKIIKFTGIMVLLISLFGVGILVADRLSLRNNIVRLHVVANSDCEEDQQIKLAVKDAIVNYLQKGVVKLDNASQAKEYLQHQLPELEQLANNVLQNLGTENRACVFLTTQGFDVRKYDTFSLPSGIYDTLRIEIGNGKGRNWWCVVFPALCLPATTEEFTDVAVSSGFGESLVNSLTGKDGYGIRFYFLDCLGKLEKFFCFS